MSCFLGCCEGQPRTTKSDFEPSGQVLPIVDASAEVEALDYYTPKAAAPSQAPQVKFSIEVHGAEIDRSFAKLGWMDPYAVVMIDGEKTMQTRPAFKAHKTPVWSVDNSFDMDGTPHELTVAIWDKNNFHKDVFCGAVTIPCDPDMGRVDHQEFGLTKRAAATGTVRLSLGVTVMGQHQSRSMSRSSSCLGGELDLLIRTVSGNKGGLRSSNTITFQESSQSKKLGFEDDDEAVEHPGLRMKERSISTARVDAPGAALLGHWKCVDTHGLEAFLKATNVGYFQQKLALRLAWPSWEFRELHGDLQFVNHSAIGVIEELVQWGTPYAYKDGHGNAYECTAEWTPGPNGGSLVIDRKGDVASYSETRTVEGNVLRFELNHNLGGKWGRTFERA